MSLPVAGTEETVPGSAGSPGRRARPNQALLRSVLEDILAMKLSHVFHPPFQKACLQAILSGILLVMSFPNPTEVQVLLAWIDTSGRRHIVRGSTLKGRR